MTIKVGGRLIVMFAAGLIAYFAGPLHAALKSGEPETVSRYGWLGDTLAPSDLVNIKPLAGGKAGSSGDKSRQPITLAQAQVVPPDQLNDIDRALAGTPYRTTVGVAPPIRPAAVRVAPIIVPSSSEAWDQTSLVGKIFVGIGACLTLASAARMFMA
jgi:hypothetical protein